MNFIECKLIKKGDDFYCQFGTEDTKTRKGVKYDIKVPAYKNEKNVLDKYEDKTVIMGIRPEDLHDEEDRINKLPDGLIEANVEVTELMGAEIYLYVNCEGASLIARVEPTSKAHDGDTIKMAFDNDRIHLFDKETEQAICF